MSKFACILSTAIAVYILSVPGSVRALDGAERLPENPDPAPVKIAPAPANIGITKPTLPPVPLTPPVLAAPASTGPALPTTAPAAQVTPPPAVPAGPAPQAAPAAPVEQPFAKTFTVNKENLVTTGRSTFFVLEPGYQLQYLGAKGSSEVITVLTETKQIDGVETRVIQKCEFEHGVVSIVNRTYVALDKSTQDIYMFGEDIDDYENGVVINHDGSWTAGKAGAQWGLMLPGTPVVGQRYYQNQAPKSSMDRAEVVSVGNKVTVTAGTFENCLMTEETTDLDLTSKDVNYYAPNVGLVIDGEYKLLKYVVPSTGK